MGWHDFSAGFKLYRWPGSAKPADQGLVNVTGNLWGGDGSRDTWGSTDGSYGPNEAVGSSVADGSMSLRTDRPMLLFSLSNNGSTSLSLQRIAFDFASVNNNSPQNLRLLYESGDLNVPNGTQIAEWRSILNGLDTVSDYEDVEVELSLLADRSLAPGQSATFRFVPDTARNNVQALGIDNVAILGESFDEFRVVTYNIHGGKGPNDAGTVSGNLTAFRDDFLTGEDVLCLQEVDLGEVWDTVRTVFSDYPYRYQTVNTTTRYSGLLSFLNKETSVAILSKYPFVSTHSKLVNTDPSIDRWERHGQHVAIEVGGEIVHVFNYHNTFDPEDGGTSSEVAGMEKFRDYVTERLGAEALTVQGRVLALGDFNINGALTAGLMPHLVDRATDWVDHVASMSHFSASGVYSTGGAQGSAQISDHDAVWAQLDLSGPSPSTAQWASFPAEAGTTSISMTAQTGTDLNEVSYFFTNTSFPDGSHDSGWQSSPTYLDTGLPAASPFTYTVKMRDQSANQNESTLSAPATATTDDGDSLPNDWELLYFPSLSATAGEATEDFDGDGWSDFNEWVAGTDPTDPNSLLEVETAVAENGAGELRWNTVAGKSYRVWRSRNLQDDWLPESEEILAVGTELSFPMVLADEESVFYRVEVLPGPVE